MKLTQPSWQNPSLPGKTPTFLATMQGGGREEGVFGGPHRRRQTGDRPGVIRTTRGGGSEVNTSRLCNPYTEAGVRKYSICKSALRSRGG